MAAHIWILVGDKRYGTSVIRILYRPQGLSNQPKHEICPIETSPQGWLGSTGGTLHQIWERGTMYHGLAVNEISFPRNHHEQQEQMWL